MLIRVLSDGALRRNKWYNHQQLNGKLLFVMKTGALKHLENTRTHLSLLSLRAQKLNTSTVIVAVT